MKSKVSQSEIERVRDSSRRMVRALGLLGQAHASLGISNSQVHALVEIEREGPLSLIELSKRLCLEKSSVSRMVEIMLEKKWVTTSLDSKDARRKLVALLPAGRKILSSIHSQASKRVSKALMQLSHQQREQVINGLEIYADVLTKNL